jgi:hypothetical protein
MRRTTGQGERHRSERRHMEVLAGLRTKQGLHSEAAGLGRSEARCRSVAVGLARLTRRCRANTRVRHIRRTPLQEAAAGPQAKQGSPALGCEWPGRRRRQSVPRRFSSTTLSAGAGNERKLIPYTLPQARAFRARPVAEQIATLLERGLDGAGIYPERRHLQQVVEQAQYRGQTVHACIGPRRTRAGVSSFRYSSVIALIRDICIGTTIFPG